MTETVIKNINQQRAKIAYNFVLNIIGKNDSVKKQYKTGVKKLAVLIKTNGLGQTLAYLKNRNDGLNLLYEQLSNWFIEIDLIKNETSKNNKDLIAQVIEKNSSDYLQLTHESLAFTNWLRRLADALMKDVEEYND